MPSGPTVVLLPGQSLEDFLTEGSDDLINATEECQAGVINAFAVAWHPSLIAASRQLPLRGFVEGLTPDLAHAQLVICPNVAGESELQGCLVAARVEPSRIVSGHPHREQMVAEALRKAGCTGMVDAEIASDFMAFGVCQILLDLLTREMRNFSSADEHSLASHAVEAAMAATAGDNDLARLKLQQAFELLRDARERFYPVDCHIVDMCLLKDDATVAEVQAELHAEYCPVLLTNASQLETLCQQSEPLRKQLSTAVQQNSVEIVAGIAEHPAVPLLPLETLIGHLIQTQRTFEHYLGVPPTIFGGRGFFLSAALPSILSRFGYAGTLHFLLSQGKYPDGESTVKMWQGIGGTEKIPALTRIPLGILSPRALLQYPSRMAETMDNDFVAALLIGRWCNQKSQWLSDLRRIHAYAPVLGRFSSIGDVFAQDSSAGRVMETDSESYRHCFLDDLCAEGHSHPISHIAEVVTRTCASNATSWCRSLQQIIEFQPDEQSGPLDLPLVGNLKKGEVNLETVSNSSTSAAELAFALTRSGTTNAGVLVFNTLSFRRTVTVRIPETPGSLPGGRSVLAVDDSSGDTMATLELPAFGYQWVAMQPVRRQSLRSNRPMSQSTSRMQTDLLDVQIDDTTGGIAKACRRGLEASGIKQELVFRSRARSSFGTAENGDGPSYASAIDLQSLELTSESPVGVTAVSTGNIVSIDNDDVVGQFRQSITAYEHRPFVELLIELSVDHTMNGSPWENYFASAFTALFSGMTLRKSVHEGCHAVLDPRIDSPHFICMSNARARVTILPMGYPYHRRTGPRTIETILIAGNERSRTFRMGIDFSGRPPLTCALDALTSPAVQSVAGMPEFGERKSFLSVRAPTDVQVLQLCDVRSADLVTASIDDGSPSEMPSMRVRLFESDGALSVVEIIPFRVPHAAWKCDFKGRRTEQLEIVNGAAVLELEPYEIADVEMLLSAALSRRPD